MARIDALHWEVGPGDNWQKIATATHVSRAALLAANGQPKTNPALPADGQILHIPFWKAGE